jgi:hypothetical protein
LHAVQDVAKPVASSIDKRNSYSLADFLAPKPQPKTKAPVLASWASPQKVVTAAPSTKTKRLAEIQAEETDFKAREDRACEGEKAWFMGRRERADSLHAIQEAAKQERDMHLLIQEQMEIEAQIQRDLAAQRRKEQNKTPKTSKATKKGATPRIQSAILSGAEDSTHDADRKSSSKARRKMTSIKDQRRGVDKGPAPPKEQGSLEVTAAPPL